MQQRNNKILAGIILTAAFLLAIPLKWFALRPGATVFFTLPGGSVDITGVHGTISLASMQMPIWLLLMISAAATAVMCLNLARVTSVPKMVIAAALLIPGLFYMTPLFLTGSRYPAMAEGMPPLFSNSLVAMASNNLSLGIGSVIAILATVAALLFTFLAKPDRQ